MFVRACACACGVVGWQLRYMKNSLIRRANEVKKSDALEIAK